METYPTLSEFDSLTDFVSPSFDFLDEEDIVNTSRNSLTRLRAFVLSSSFSIIQTPIMRPTFAMITQHITIMRQITMAIITAFCGQHLSRIEAILKIRTAHTSSLRRV